MFISDVKQCLFQMLNNAKVEAQLQIQRAILDERNKKEIAVQQAIAQTRTEMGAGKGDGITVVTYEGWTGHTSQANIPNIMVAQAIDSVNDK